MIISKLIVIGASAGGLNAITTIVKSLPDNFVIPIIIVLHIPPHSNGFWISSLDSQSKLEVREAEEKEFIKSGNIYVAPPNYHLLVEEDGSLSLSTEAKVNFSRPSIDVLFETAAEAFRYRVTGILLSGSNKDGASGLKKIKENGGTVIVQDPSTAEYNFMPQAALDLVKADYIFPLDKIIKYLIQLTNY